MKLTKAFIKYVDGAGDFWINPITCFANRHSVGNVIIIQAYADNAGEPSKQEVLINFNNVVYIKFFNDIKK